MSERSSWTGNAADLLRMSVERSSQSGENTGLPKNPRALAGHLRRAQTCLRTLGIDIAFGREGRAGTRVIRIRRSPEFTVSTVSNVSSARDCKSKPDSEEYYSVGSQGGSQAQLSTLLTEPAADGADGTDARPPFIPANRSERDWKGSFSTE